MIRYSEFFFPSSDGKTQIHVNKWIPDNMELKGVVQIAHGVSEYGKRYDRFACFLAERGYVVVANDHLGHGQSLIKDCPMVYFGEKGSWWYPVDDVEALRKMVHKEYPKLPYVLFGHSMGSFITRSHLIKYPGTLDGVIICGTGFLNKFMVAGGKLVANLEIKRIGRKGFSSLADKLAFGAYNNAFKPVRTAFDWLSVNSENVDNYIADPLCGGQATVGLFRELLDGLSFVNNKENIVKVNKDQPVFFISGDHDPVGEMGKGVTKAYNAFKKANIKNVDIKLYKGLRHEILNEKEYMEVQEDILHWLEENIEK